MYLERMVVAGLSVILLVSGCSAGWRRVEPAAHGAYHRRQQVQIWTGSQSRILHSVRFDASSLSGVPFTKHPECSSCRIAIPLATVDSVRVGNKETGFFILMGTLAVASLLVVGVMAGDWGD